MVWERTKNAMAETTEVPVVATAADQSDQVAAAVEVRAPTMAEQTAVKEDGQGDACPTFVIQAGGPVEVRALVAAFAALGRRDEALVREFELWEEAHRGTGSSVKVLS